jgi:hypothetical protein
VAVKDRAAALAHRSAFEHALLGRRWPGDPT